MSKIKLVTVVGTRPELIRLSRTIPKLDLFYDHILVHTGQNYDYELNEIFFKDLGIRKPNYFLKAAGKNSIETIGKVIIEVNKILIKEKPNAVFVLGDTNSCLSLLAAKKNKIPTFHMEAGNRCFDQRVPEEINRKIVDHIADINLTYSSISRNYLINEGINPERCITVGSPMFEIINFYKNKIKKSKILTHLKLKKQRYLLLSIHREENIDIQKNFNAVVKILNKLAVLYKSPIIVSTHPRTRNKIKNKKIKFHKNIIFLKPLSFTDYNNLQINSIATLSDSGTINEESSILNFPALNIRESHERLEAMEEGAVIMTGLKIENIISSLNIIKNQKRGSLRTIHIPKDYNTNNVSDKVVRIIMSHIDYVNRKLWLK